jgi:coproporphyrinogen III oxidase
LISQSRGLGDVYKRQVQWHYDHHPAAGSEEEKIVKVLEKPINWIED